MKNKFTDLNQR